MTNESEIKACFESEKKEASEAFCLIFSKCLRYSLVFYLFAFVVQSFFGNPSLMHLLIFCVLGVPLTMISNNLSLPTVWTKNGLIGATNLYFLVFAYYVQPQYSGLLLCCSVLFTYNIHANTLLDKPEGFFLLTSHCIVWFFFQSFLISLPDISVLFTLVLTFSVQFFWYSKTFDKEFQNLSLRVNLEANQVNITHLLDAIPEGIVVIDSQDKILMKNTAYQNLFKDTDFSMMNHVQKYHNNMYKINLNIEEDIKLFRLKPENTISFGIIQNRSHFIECTATKIQWNTEPAIVLTFRNISEVLNLEFQVTQVSKTLNILSGVSHELKTPLNFIINQQLEALDAQNENFKMPEHVEKTLKKSLSSSYFLLSLVKDMIDYSYLKINDLALSCTWIDIVQVIEACVKIIHDMHPKCKIILEYPSLNKPTVYTDCSKVRQIILALISIAIGLNNNAEVAIQVNDNDENTELIITFNAFNNFFKDPPSTLTDLKNNFKLKVSKKIIKVLTNSDLYIKVMRPDSIKFRVSFPHHTFEDLEDTECIVPEEGAIIAPYSRSNLLKPLLRKLVDILIVDDIELNLSILRKLIKNLEDKCKCPLVHTRYKVHSASSGKEALYLIKHLEELESGYKMVLMDCFMPEIDGWEATKAIRSMFENKEIQFLPYIIAYSAYDSNEAIKRNEESGMSGRISKPCYQDELCRELHKWLSQPVRKCNKL